jgi:hypothetical protein
VGETVPEVFAQEIVEDLEAALEQFRGIAADLGADRAWPTHHQESREPDVKGGYYP